MLRCQASVDVLLPLLELHEKVLRAVAPQLQSDMEVIHLARRESNAETGRFETPSSFCDIQANHGANIDRRGSGVERGAERCLAIEFWSDVVLSWCICTVCPRILLVQQQLSPKRIFLTSSFGAAEAAQTLGFRYSDGQDPEILMEMVKQHSDSPWVRLAWN